jgi:DNA polymerase III epsilon subunit-like protein
LSYKLPKEYTVLDFETDGLPKGGDYSGVDITEVGHILWDGSSVARTNHSLAQPARNGVVEPLTAKIVEITHITDAMLVGQPLPVEAFEQQCKELVHGDDHIVGHNIIGFDKHFCDKYCDMLGWPHIDNSRYIDTAALFKTYRRAHRAGNTNWSLPHNQAQFYDWALNVLERSWHKDQVKFNLTAAVGYLGIPQFGIPYERHRAIFDDVLTQRVLERLREEMGL